MTHRYILEKYKSPASRYRCPQCGMQRRFTRYIDTATGQHVADQVGRCDRQDSCGYHYSPRAYFDDHRSLAPAAMRYTAPRQRAPVSAPEPSFIDPDIMLDTQRAYGLNHFVRWLGSRYSERQVQRLICDYHIGTSSHWQGATIFWQIDAQERIRTGKVMLYDPVSGKRIKEPVARISWVHSLLGLRDYELRQCLYGEHLLGRDTTRPVAVVESEKTAMIASLHMPEYWWLATGGKEQLTAERMAVLAGRRVMLFPDAGAYDLWSRRAAALSDLMLIRVSDMLEKHSKAGRDIADFLL